MITYYKTLFCVFILSYIAQAIDNPHLSRYSELQVQHTRSSGLFYGFAVLVLVLVAGLRYQVGTDYVAYYFGYKAYAASLWNAIRLLNEPGFPLIAKIAQLIHDDAATAIFIAALVTIWPAMKVIYKHTDKLLLASLLFIFLGCWDGSFNGVRQYLAATMLFCGYEALEAKQLKKYALWVFIAFLFHRSAVVMIALYFVVYRKINKKNLLRLSIATIFILVAYDRFLTIAGWITESNYTLENEYTSHAVHFLRVLASCAPAVVFLVLLWSRPKDEKMTFYLNLIVIHAAFRVATMSSALLYRIGIYTTLFQVIAIPELLKNVEPETRKLLTVSMILLFAILWWYELYSHQNMNNYHWIWNRY